MTGLPFIARDSWHPLQHSGAYIVLGNSTPCQQNLAIFPWTNGNQIGGTFLHDCPQHSQILQETYYGSFFDVYPASPIPGPWLVCAGTLIPDPSCLGDLAQGLWMLTGMFKTIPLPSQNAPRPVRVFSLHSFYASFLANLNSETSPQAHYRHSSPSDDRANSVKWVLMEL